MLELYRTYLFTDGSSKRERTITSHKRDLKQYALGSPDFHPEAKRNGVEQGFLFTRGGEENSYNIICLPDEELFAGDLIDAFGEKWIVTEARADDTTHKTGIMHQCNHLFRFQNFSPEIIEEWGYIDQSGYSSTITGTNQIQKSEEQVAIYMPYNENTKKIFVDKRLASHVAYEKTGREILSTYKVTSASPVSRSFNQKDHLLLLKAVRDVYNEQADSLEEQICDYISESGGETQPPSEDLLSCAITGSPSINLGRTRTFKGVFYQEDGVTIDESIIGNWEYSAEAAEKGIAFEVSGNQLKVVIPFISDMIGYTFEITLKDAAGKYSPSSIEVEVGNIV